MILRKYWNDFSEEALEDRRLTIKGNVSVCITK